MQEAMVNAINKHAGWTRISGPHVQCKHVVPIYVTFSDCMMYSSYHEPNVESSFCNRLLSSYLNLQKYDPRESHLFDNVRASDLTEFIRAREATERGCVPEEICIVVLVDSLHRVAAYDGEDKMSSEALDVIYGLQERAMEGKKPTFAVVSTMDFNGLFQRVTEASKRSLHVIQVRPCSSEDMDELVERCVVAAEERGERFDEATRDAARWMLRWCVHATRGHFRSIRALVMYFKENGCVPPLERQYRSSYGSAAYILDILARQLCSTSLKETDLIGAAFSKPRPKTQVKPETFARPLWFNEVKDSLHDIAMSNKWEVFYEEVDGCTAMVRPCVGLERLNTLL
ncbi:Hypothetical protein, putative, partial [Bodo saltans]